MKRFPHSLFSGWRAVAASLLVFIAALIAGYYGGLTLAFSGPGSSAGSGSGAIASDGAGRITIGSSTVQSNTALTVVASTTGSSNYALRVVSPTFAPLLIVRDDGNVSVASTTPGYKFVVSVATDSLLALERSSAANPTIFKLGTDSALIVSNGGSDLLALKSGNVGVGTTTPSYKLDVSGGDANVSGVYRKGGTAGISLTCSSGQTVATTTVSGGIITGGICASISGGGGSPGGSNGHVQFNSSGSFGGDANLFWDNASKRLGIGTSTPSTQLSVGTNTASLVAVFGGGSGKIDAGTVDPVYTIGGERYATYLPSMTGVKEETTGVVHVPCPMSHVPCRYAIDFNNLEKGSDLWLFSKTTDLKNNFDAMSVLLTPSFDGRVWYEKDEVQRTLTIFAEPHSPFSILHSPEISYRLTAPRFDWQEWPNISDSINAGFILEE